MVRDKKGISNVVSVLLIVLLVIIAIGVVWFVIRGTLQSGAGEIGLGAKCLQVDIQATQASCITNETGNYDLCNVTVKRNAGGEEIGGVKLIFSNAAGDDTHVEDSSGAISELETKTINNVQTTGIANVTKTEVAVYFLDDSGNEQLCSGTTAFDNVADAGSL